MRRTQSDPTLVFDTKRSIIGEHIGNAVPGYTGHVPAMRMEAPCYFERFSSSVQLARAERSNKTFNQQVHRLTCDDRDRKTRTMVPPTRLPTYDNRGISHPAAGDVVHSRVPASNEEKAHYQSSMGLTSLAHENLGGAGQLKGYGAASRGIPGYKGFIPGKNAENCFAETWSKNHERSLNSHFNARGRAPKSWTLLTEGHTTTMPVDSDTLAEIPIRNPSYQDHARGWSDCTFSGHHIDPAGRLAPMGRQESYSLAMPPVNKQLGLGFHGSVPIHGYAGCVPGRVGENVVGERQCKTNAISDHLFKKSRMRNTQR